MVKRYPSDKYEMIRWIDEFVDRAESASRRERGLVFDVETFDIAVMVSSIIRELIVTAPDLLDKSIMKTAILMNAAEAFCMKHKILN